MSTRYDEVPPDAPKPKLWKCLGHIGVGLEAHYALESWHGDLDVDREHDLAVELSSCITMLVSNGRSVDGLYLVKDVQMPRYASSLLAYRASLLDPPVPAKRQLMVRFVACDCASRPTKMRCS